MSLRIAYLTAGGAGMFCGSCMRDNTLAAALHRQGVDAQLIPLYTPIRTDEAEVTVDRVFYGGINVYLQQNYPWLAAIPGLGSFFDWSLDQPWLINFATGFGIETNAALLGEITISVLEGEDGRLKHEADKLCDWLAKEVRPDIINLSNILIAGCVPELKRRLKVPIVVTLQGDDIFLRDLTEPYKTKAFERIRALVAEIDGFVVFSRYYADFMAGYFGIPPEKIQVVTMGIDTRDFAAIDGSKEQRKEAEKGPVVGYLARLAPEKGLHILVDAFLRLRQMQGMEKARLHVAGWLGGKNQAYADAEFRRLREVGAADSFQYFGTVDRKQKLDFLRGIDVLSVPTTYHEPKGLFVLEALAAGVPVVQPAHGAFPELIEATGGGWLCRPDDPQHLAELLGEALRDDAARRAKGSAGREAVHSRFHADQAARETLALYQRMLGAPIDETLRFPSQSTTP